MAETNTQKLTVTLVGQSQSGKTNLLSAFLFNPNALDDLAQGQDRILNPFVKGLAPPGTPEVKHLDELSDHHRSILRGMDTEGTEHIRRYPCELTFQVEKKPSGLGRLAVRSVQLGQTTVGFDIVDGRGGDLAPEEYIDPNDPENADKISRQQEYRMGLRESVGMVICVSVQTESFDSAMAQRLMNEINSAIDEKSKGRDAVPLERVAFCITKYDSLFAADGPEAEDRAIDRDGAITNLKGEAMFKVFAPALKEQMGKLRFKSLIFPCSTFGFVRDDGSANVYPYDDKKFLRPRLGLLTRAVDPKIDYSDPEKPNYKDHFPVALTEGQAANLWRPFNIAPAILFALTGRVTGPLALDPADLL